MLVNYAVPDSRFQATDHNSQWILACKYCFVRWRQFRVATHLLALLAKFISRLLMLRSVGACMATRRSLPGNDGWNDCFRKIFDFHRWESVKELQWFLQGELPFEFIYDLYRWKFLTKRYISDKLCLLMDLSNLQSGYVSKLAKIYGEDVISKQDMAASIANYFTNCIST